MKNEKEIFNGFLIYTILWLHVVSPVCKISRAKSENIVQAWRERGYVNTERNKLKGTINKWKDIWRTTLEHSGGLEMSLQKNNSKMYQCPSAET